MYQNIVKKINPINLVKKALFAKNYIILGFFFGKKFCSHLIIQCAI